MPGVAEGKWKHMGSVCLWEIWEASVCGKYGKRLSVGNMGSVCLWEIWKIWEATVCLRSIREAPEVTRNSGGLLFCGHLNQANKKGGGFKRDN
jgi:hypothetical protein